MTQDDAYIISVVNKYKLPETIDNDTTKTVFNPLSKIITDWAGDCLSDIKLSGSRAKGTAICLATDLDIFISLKSSTAYTLKEIYNSLHDEIIRKKITARKQNVSIGVNYNRHDVDLVPAKRQDNYGQDHSIYKSKADTWTKTNINTHIKHVKDSGRITEIVALKIWRERNKLDFPSIYLELVAIEALKYRNKNQPAKNFWAILEYLRDEFVNKTFYDPANTNNKISDDLYKYEKEIIYKKAVESLLKTKLEDIVW